MHSLRLCALGRSASAARGFSCTSVVKCAAAAAEDDPKSLKACDKAAVFDLTAALHKTHNRAAMSELVEKLKGVVNKPPASVTSRVLCTLLRDGVHQPRSFEQAKELLGLLARRPKFDDTAAEILMSKPVTETLAKYPVGLFSQLVEDIPKATFEKALGTCLAGLKQEDWEARCAGLPGTSTADGFKLGDTELMHVHMSACLLQKDYAKFVEYYQSLDVATPATLALLIRACHLQAKDNPESSEQFLALAEQAFGQSGSDNDCERKLRSFKADVALNHGADAA
eukprot:TRINITY_DN7052_c0_g1_i1.p1 TRINITY_DN7052_c0_g1~~TRINITY_DN7052_c0_g1_i1.p1  ORF type:complete len:300 (+),score=90.77 TRINITY_DN7052_c0_g1_i1:54-902(+)